MSGVKRRTAYRKAVTDAVSDTYPVPATEEKIVQVLRSHGSNLLEVKTASGATGMCMMPTKYRKLIWVARGDFLIASEAAADVVTASGSSGTVRFLVEHILREPQIGVLQIKGLWPEAFKDVTVSKKALDEAQRECSHEHRTASATAERDAAAAAVLEEEEGEPADVAMPATGAGTASGAAATAAASAAVAAACVAGSTTAMEGLTAGAGKQLVSSDEYDAMLGMGPGRNHRGRRAKEEEEDEDDDDDDDGDSDEEE